MLSLKISIHRRLKLVAYSGVLKLDNDYITISTNSLLSGETELAIIPYDEIKDVEINSYSIIFNLKNGNKIPQDNYWVWFTINSKYVHFLKDYIKAKIENNQEEIKILENVYINNQFETYFMNDEKKEKWKQRKKTSKIISIVLLCVLIMLIVGTIILVLIKNNDTSSMPNYYESNEYKNLSPKNKAISILEREGEYDLEENLYTLYREDYYSSSIFEVGSTYYINEDELIIYFIQIDVDNDNTKIVTQIWLDDYSNEFLFGIKILDHTDSVVFAEMGTINSTTFSPYSYIPVDDITYPESLKTELEVFCSSYITTLLEISNNNFKNYNLALNDFGFIYF